MFKILPCRSKFVLDSLDSTKKTSGVIPKKIVKLANKVICNDLANCIIEPIKKSKFSNELKEADIPPVFEKEDPLNKENYRPVSVLPTISKIFERILFDQLTKFSNKFLSPNLRDFRKGHSTQNALVNLLQKRKKVSKKLTGLLALF